MLTEERFSHILSILEEVKTVSVQELCTRLDASESTIRRDLTKLDQMGKLRKFHGGATLLNARYTTEDDSFSVRSGRNIESKGKISKYAASLIEEGDFIYIDAGTTTEMISRYLSVHNIGIVTNSIIVARSLAVTGHSVTLLGGEIKPLTEAIVGPMAIADLRAFNFTKGFFGTNGIHPKCGYTTPQMNEASIKIQAMSQCAEKYILADASKFNSISSVTFGKLSDAMIITDTLKEPLFRDYTAVMEVDTL